MPLKKCFSVSKSFFFLISHKSIVICVVAYLSSAYIMKLRKCYSFAYSRRLIKRTEFSLTYSPFVCSLLLYYHWCRRHTKSYGNACRNTLNSSKQTKISYRKKGKEKQKKREKNNIDELIRLLCVSKNYEH